MRKWPGYINIYSPSKRLYRVPLKEFVLTPERCGVTQAQCDSCCYCMEYGTVPVTPGNVKKYIEEKILA